MLDTSRIQLFDPNGGRNLTLTDAAEGRRAVHLASTVPAAGLRAGRRCVPPMTTWWQRGAIYQIYPRSFADATATASATCAGSRSGSTTSRTLGRRGGLAVADLPAPRWPTSATTSPTTATSTRSSGRWTTSTADRGGHARGIRIILDWVPNHTSDRHPWFEASRSSRDDPQRDWYVWRDGAPGGGPPNDWASVFAAVGRAWTFDDAHRASGTCTRSCPSSPTSTGTTPRSRRRCTTCCASGSTAGVDGFRLDAIAEIAKDPLLRDQTGAPRAHTRTGTRSTSGCAASAASSTSTTTG